MDGGKLRMMKENMYYFKTEAYPGFRSGGGQKNTSRNRAQRFFYSHEARKYFWILPPAPDGH